LIFTLLPAGWSLRDWKFSDKRTKKYRYITKSLLVLWLIFGALSAFYHWDQNNKNQNLQNRVGELLQNISGLSKQIEEYQKEIRKKMNA